MKSVLKPFIIFILCLLISGIFFFTGYKIWTKWQVSTQSLNTVKIYSAAGLVSEINEIENTITIEDFDGNLWSVYSDQKYNIGTLCALSLSDNATAEIEDDIVLEVKYYNNN